MVLRGAGGVVRRRLLAVDGAPGVQRSDLAHLAGASAGGVEQLPAEAHRLAGRFGHRVREERHHVDLGVPEVVAVIAASRDALGGDALLVRSRRRLGQLVQIPAQRLLGAVVAAEFDVGAGPELVEPDALLVDDLLDAVGLGALQRARTPVGQLDRRNAVRRVVRHELGDLDRTSRRCAHREHGLGEVGAHIRRDVDLARGVDVVPRRAGECHPAVRAPVSEHDLVAVLALQLRLEDSLAELARPARILPLAEGGGLHVVLVLAVLTVEELRGDHHGRRSVEERDLEGHHGEVAVHEADQSLRCDPDSLARWRAPDQVARQHPVAEIDGALVGVEIGGRQQQRLVVDVQLEQLGVGHVDDRLAGLGEAVRLLGMHDRPRLVEPVEVGAVAVGLTALLGIGSHPQIAVAECEQGLEGAEIVVGVRAFDESPWLDGEPVLGQTE